MNEQNSERRGSHFVCYFHFVAWDCISLGLHVCFSAPNIEIHLPFGFIRIGWEPRHTVYVRMVGGDGEVQKYVMG